MRRTKHQKGRGDRNVREAGPAPAPVLQGAGSRILLPRGYDINTNIGEGFGPYRVDGEQEILPFVTSANVACGAHSGDPSLMEAALESIRYYGLALGAHIGYPDLAGFGRREIHLSSSELRASVLYQLGALSGLARTFGLEITQVRPHGFLYRQMSHDIRIATIVARAIAEYDRWLVLLGPAGNILLASGERAGLRVAGEAWVDRAYDANGNLLPHTHSRAMLKTPQEVMKQVNSLLRYGEVTASDGTRVPLEFETIHLHSRIPQAHAVAEEIRRLVPDASALTAEPFSLDTSEDGEIFPSLAYSV
ncbi:MAG TPA: 5-oxoprolinase subunit PxpA [Candidatus Obscuribacter sp.]|nr:LamB/YcsF family protein [Candidatus Melainabacteria bacterium]MDX1989904.1 5-oxoprolinase subunit PxpA [Candidatus Obscuribacter sp.]HMW92887.1 5-oxoprolinase subunit PxpA [Candidatus Obscuribacter sp.]HMX47193.1 5-oxoprolinase subunit PxpA [Candidatus Obscuribacter sp.]HMY02476.1 5-oxoprolinase subunit PxpA [Candidatus Obscuribacter sp.]